MRPPGCIGQPKEPFSQALAELVYVYSPFLHLLDGEVVAVEYTANIRVIGPLEGDSLIQPLIGKGTVGNPCPISGPRCRFLKKGSDRRSRLQATNG